jgi:hypothetical protein
LNYDIQERIQDAYVCAAKMIKNKQIIRSIYQLGTDVSENQFATLRTLSHSRNFDFLELTDHASRTNNSCWRAKSKLNSTGETVDYSYILSGKRYIYTKLTLLICF